MPKITIVTLILILAAGAWGLFWRKPATNADIIAGIERCSETLDGNACYEKLGRALVKKFSPTEIFQTITEAESHNQKVFQKCHETLHFVGQAAYQKQKNVSRALANGSPLCFAGYYHGVLEAYLKEKNLLDADSEPLKAEVPKICAPLAETQKNYDECLHGLGHALMYATNYELLNSLELCDEFESNADEQWCYSGSFMENSTSSTNKDHPSQYLKKDDLMYPCSILEDKYLNMCYTLQGFYFAEISQYDWQQTGDICRQVPPPYDLACFHSIGQSQVGFTTDPQVMKQNCRIFPEKKYQSSCFAGVAGALLQRYHNGSEIASKFCALLDREFRNECESIIR